MHLLGVTLIGIYQVLRGLVGILFALSLMLFSGMAVRLTSLSAEGNAIERFLHGYGRVAGIAILVFALLHILAGVGLLKMQNWGRLLTLLLSAIALVTLLPVLLASHGVPLIFAVINAASIFYLAAPPIRRAFHSEGSALRAAA
jgi:uncharacterized membrane protein (DUF2068 family)